MNVPPNGTMETNGQQEVFVDADTHEDAIIMAIEQNELEGDIGDTLAIWVTPTPEDPASVDLCSCNDQRRNRMVRQHQPDHANAAS